MLYLSTGLVIASSRVFVDETEAELEEAGDIIQAIDAGLLKKNQLAGELGEWLNREPGEIQKTSGEITIFKSVGSAVQDFVCAKDLFERANPVR